MAQCILNNDIIKYVIKVIFYFFYFIKVKKVFWGVLNRMRWNVYIVECYFLGNVWQNTILILLQKSRTLRGHFPFFPEMKLMIYEGSIFYACVSLTKSVICWN